MVSIPFHEISIQTARAGGPGGQNVNKVESKVQLRWNIGASAVFSEAQKQNIRAVLASRINSEDELMIVVDEERSQTQNKAVAIERLHALVSQALKPRKKRKPTKPTQASIEKRLAEKKKRAQKKMQRSQVAADESVKE